MLDILSIGTPRCIIKELERLTIIMMFGAHCFFKGLAVCPNFFVLVDNTLVDGLQNLIPFDGFCWLLTFGHVIHKVIIPKNIPMYQLVQRVIKQRIGFAFLLFTFHRGKS